MAMVHILDHDGVFKDVDECELVKSQFVAEDTDDYRIERTEYRRPGNDTPVHASAHLTFKRVPSLFPSQGTL